MIIVTVAVVESYSTRLWKAAIDWFNIFASTVTDVTSSVDQVLRRHNDDSCSSIMTLSFAGSLARCEYAGAASQ